MDSAVFCVFLLFSAENLEELRKILKDLIKSPEAFLAGFFPVQKETKQKWKTYFPGFFVKKTAKSFVNKYHWWKMFFMDFFSGFPWIIFPVENSWFMGRAGRARPGPAGGGPGSVLFSSVKGGSGSA